MKNRIKPSTILLSAMVLLTFSGLAFAQTPARASNEWTWMGGSSLVDQRGVYGRRGTSATATTPGARVYASSWADAEGNLWLFGGYGASAARGEQGDLNDLWKFSDGEWTWVDGSNVTEHAGIYGRQGVAAKGNVPGARYQAVHWRDASGNFWLFGGLGIDSTGARGRLNDLWKYSNGSWTWMGGSNLIADSVAGIYGTKKKSAPSNQPGARVDASAWADSSGNLWLFGGLGYDSTGVIGILNDLWKYSDGEWTWMSGSNRIGNVGRYGMLGEGTTQTHPGARTNAVTWIDANGSLWLFGGEGQDLNGRLCVKEAGGLPCDLNDLWKYSDGIWTWVGGSDIIAAPGEYGTQGAAAPGNFPGARDSAISWTDAAGNFWLYGGFGYDSTTGAFVEYGDLNDLWKFSGGEWTWVSGSKLAGQQGIYGTEGKINRRNIAGARDSAVSWSDAEGNLWLFGGGDYLSVFGGGKFNDLWKYKP